MFLLYVGCETYAIFSVSDNTKREPNNKKRFVGGYRCELANSIFGTNVHTALQRHEV